MTESVPAVAPSAPPSQAPPKRGDDPPSDAFAVALGSAAATESPPPGAHAIKARTAAAEGKQAEGDSSGQTTQTSAPAGLPAAAVATAPPLPAIAPSANLQAPPAASVRAATGTPAGKPTRAGAAAPAPAATTATPANAAAPAAAVATAQPPAAAAAPIPQAPPAAPAAPVVARATATPAPAAPAPQPPVAAAPAETAPVATTTATAAGPVPATGSVQKPRLAAAKAAPAPAPARPATTTATAPATGRPAGHASGGQTGAGTPQDQNPPPPRQAEMPPAAGNPAPSGHQPAPVPAVSAGTGTAPAAAAPVAAPAATPAARPDAPAATLTANARMQDLADVTSTTMRLAVRSGQPVARITLQPEGLGGVQVTMRYHDNGVSATVTTDNRAAAQELLATGADLRRSLESQGVTVHGLDVQLSGEDRGSNQNGERAADTARAMGPAGGGDADSDEAETTIQPSRLPLPGSQIDVFA